jgi:hypothetical protein
MKSRKIVKEEWNFYISIGVEEAVRSWLIRRPDILPALKAACYPEALFSLDAGFLPRVTPQQPKFLCSSHLGGDSPSPPAALAALLFGILALSRISGGHEHQLCDAGSHRCSKAAPKGGPRLSDFELR